MTVLKYARPEDFAQPGARFERTDLSKTTAETPELRLGLVYRGFPTTIFGPTGSAKTLLALALTLEAQRAGLRVAYWDEELGAGPMAARLRALGATTEELAAVAYYGWQAPGLEDSDAFVAEMSGQDIVVLDPVADLLVAAGVDENANSEFTEWAARFPQRLTHAGVASILIDGSPHADGRDGKGRESRQRGATQKGYKAALVWRVEVLDEPTKEHMGLISLECTKDRFGDVGKGAKMTFAIGGDGNGRILFERRDSMDQPALGEQAAQDRREWLASIVEVLAQHARGYDRAITQNQLVQLLPPGRLALKRAMCQLAASSAVYPVHSRPGRNQSLLYWYSEAGESQLVPVSPDASGLTGVGDSPQVSPTKSVLTGDSVIRDSPERRRGDDPAGATGDPTPDSLKPRPSGPTTGFAQFLAEIGTDAAWARVSPKTNDAEGRA